MTEIIHPRDGDSVWLHPCPPLYTLSQHFADDEMVYAEDGFHHEGPQIAIPTAYRMLAESPESVVKVILRAWTDHLDAEPGPGHIELQLATTEDNTDMYVELTPDQARAVSAALLKLADVGAFDFDLD